LLGVLSPKLIHSWARPRMCGKNRSQELQFARRRWFLLERHGGEVEELAHVRLRGEGAAGAARCSPNPSAAGGRARKREGHVEVIKTPVQPGADRDAKGVDGARTSCTHGGKHGAGAAGRGSGWCLSLRWGCGGLGCMQARRSRRWTWRVHPSWATRWVVTARSPSASRTPVCPTRSAPSCGW
jgi:hypothetical protein